MDAEFVRLTYEALALLRSRAALRLSMRPSFANSISWTLRRKRDAEEFQLNRATWRRDLDAEKFRSPIERLRYSRQLSPTIETESWLIEAAAAEAWLSPFEGLRLPCFVPGQRIGLDGTAYEYESSDGFSGCAVTWWEQAPTQWQQLETLFHHTWREFESTARS